MPDLAFRLLVKEAFGVILPSDHVSPRLKRSVEGSGRRNIRDCVSYGSCTACGSSTITEAIGNQYHASSRDGPRHHGNFPNNVDPRVGLLPAYAQNFLPASVTSRPLKGDAPTVDLVSATESRTQSPILKLLLSRVDELVRSCVEEDPLKLSMHRRDPLNLPIRRTSHISNR